MLIHCYADKTDERFMNVDVIDIEERNWQEKRKWQTYINICLKSVKQYKASTDVSSSYEIVNC